MRKYLLSVAAFAAVMFALGGPAATPARAQAPTIDACEGLYMQCQYFMGHLVSWGSGCADLSLDGSAAAPNELGVVVDEMMCEDGTRVPPLGRDGLLLLVHGSGLLLRVRSGDSRLETRTC